MPLVSRPRTAATVLGLSVVTAVALTGCATGAASSGAPDVDCLHGGSLALVVPVHAGAQAPGVPPEWDCALDAAIRRSAPISVVTVEGNPQVVVSGFRADVNTSNELVAADDVTAAKNVVVGAVSGATATSDGVDLLAALALAADLAPGGQVMSLDNGATDSGVVRTVEDGMTTVVDPADVATLVVDSSSCPSVEGARVELYGLGYQVAPAEPLSPRQHDRLEQVWRATLEACGAEVAVVALPRTGDGPTTARTARAVTPEEDPAMPTPAAGAAACEAVLPDAVVGFVADEATFLDPARSIEVIADAADRVAACPGTIEVVGTTSSAGTPDGRERLSTQRAEAVRAILADRLGVPESDVVARGLGFDRDECVEDRPDGVLDPVLAAQNRKVVIRVGA
ncbi:OmpA family protein [Cellulosimicrobium cellulans]|uniref:OmpA family protein n=1 Tax=Cellulosimicrobium cellulans TaxID=1710 RepID=UPI00209703B2|nr:OmpA family protein [Cellulosimicrobium cellulans]MCO7274081.1 OmpA family protein [Cellulosimicrobium cellulans]